MKEMDEDGSGEVDLEEFAEWWPQQEAKNSALAAAVDDRWSGARWKNSARSGGAGWRRRDEQCIFRRVAESKVKIR